MKETFLIFITKYAYICLAHFFINLELTFKFKLSQFVILYFIIENLFVFLPPRSALDNILHSQVPSLMLVILVLSPQVTFSLVCFSLRCTVKESFKFSVIKTP